MGRSDSDILFPQGQEGVGRMVPKISEALELCATIEKRCRIARMIALHGDTSLCYTVFVDIAADAQELLEHCINFEEDE